MLGVVGALDVFDGVVLLMVEEVGLELAALLVIEWVCGEWWEGTLVLVDDGLGLCRPDDGALLVSTSNATAEPIASWLGSEGSVRMISEGVSIRMCWSPRPCVMGAMSCTCEAD